ncbi:MAG: cupredoxin domain-containing protein [Solirubrobacteraceae bacterium]
MRLRSLLLPIVAAVVVAAAGLALKTSAPSMPKMSKMNMSAVVMGKTASIKISNYDYSPMKLTVRAGTKITVTNHDQTAHTLTARSGGFDSGTINPGQSKTFVVAKPGVYQYYCQFHAFMSGDITVVK